MNYYDMKVPISSQHLDTWLFGIRYLGKLGQVLVFFVVFFGKARPSSRGGGGSFTQL